MLHWSTIPVSTVAEALIQKAFGFPDLVLSWGSVLRLGGPQNHPKNEDCLGFVLGTYIPALSCFTSTRAESKINMCWTIPTSTSNVAFSNIITVGGIQHMQITCNHQPPKDQTVYGWKPEKHKQQRRTWKTQETYVSTSWIWSRPTLPGDASSVHKGEIVATGLRLKSSWEWLAICHTACPGQDKKNHKDTINRFFLLC